jgi:uncharacterized iron-regulated membrane protein
VKAFLHRPHSVLLRGVLFQVHLWVGVVVALYVSIVCVTGAALVFRIDLQRAVHPHLFTPGADGPPVDPAAVMERVRDEYPGGRLSGVDAPTTARPTYLAYVTSGERFATVLVDPVDARVLGELPEQSIVRTLQDLHFDLLAGRTGRIVNGIGGLCLLVMCLTGLVIWWPGVGGWRRGFLVDFARGWKRAIWELHGSVGIWTVLFVAMWAVTGVYFAFPSQFRAAVNWISPVTVIRGPLSDVARAGSAPLEWRDLVERARSHVPPGRFVARVVVPSTDAAAFHVLFSAVRPTPAGTTALTSVYLDQYTGALLAEPPRGGRSLGDTIMAWVAPLHVGSFGGVGVKVAWLVLGLAPPLLAATGLVMWWTRVVRSRWLRANPSRRLKPAPLS